LNWNDLEEKVCGVQKVDLEFLIKNTQLAVIHHIKLRVTERTKTSLYGFGKLWRNLQTTKGFCISNSYGEGPDFL
jgi:hypothetical protein